MKPLVMQPGFDFVGPITFATKALIVAPSKHAQARETSALSAVENSTRAVTQNLRLLEILKKVGDEGIADPVIRRITKWERQTICARRADVGTTPAATRWTNRHGRSYCRWRLMTDAERRADEQPAVRDLLQDQIAAIEGRP